MWEICRDVGGGVVVFVGLFLLVVGASKLGEWAVEFSLHRFNVHALVVDYLWNRKQYKVWKAEKSRAASLSSPIGGVVGRIILDNGDER